MDGGMDGKHVAQSLIPISIVNRCRHNFALNWSLERPRLNLHNPDIVRSLDWKVLDRGHGSQYAWNYASVIGLGFGHVVG